MAAYETYLRTPLFEQNSFRTQVPEPGVLPTFLQVKDQLPSPTWDGHPAALDCYWKAWELGFKNLYPPSPESGFVSSFWDTAYNDCIFMWDSVFITLFARYARHVFDAQRTLDNFYARQHPDGFICREIERDTGLDKFHRFDPASTGPNVMPWSEWEYFRQYADTARLARVFPVLLAYHRWLRRYRTWPNGLYWNSGWGSGMDNQPRHGQERLSAEPDPERASWLDHGHLCWVDATAQAVLSARLLTQMAAVLGRTAEVDDLRAEVARLTSAFNAQMWNPRVGFYSDVRPDGSVSDFRSIGAYWALLADLVPQERLRTFLAPLDDERAFKRPHRIPSMTPDHPMYRADGGYWLGAVWSPTVYMVLRGLRQVGEDALAHQIAMSHHGMVVKVFEETGTLWENYAPEGAAPGKPAKPDFVGWTGLSATAVLFEHVFGLWADVPKRTLTWDVRLLEAHGVQRLPFGADGWVDVHCAARANAHERPRIHATSTAPLTLELTWSGGHETLTLGT